MINCNKAIILAAGFGSRMMPATADRPKPLVTVNGKRIIDTLLDSLINKDIKDITIVRGYKKEKFDEILVKYPFIKLVDNNDYDKTNNISSIIRVIDDVNEDCYICEADLYINNPSIITNSQTETNILGSYTKSTDDWCYKIDDNGYLYDYKKGGNDCYQYYGISFWTKEDILKLKEDYKEVYYKENGINYFWEEIPFVLRKDKYKVRLRECLKEDIVEIDNYFELQALDPSYK